MGIDGALGLKEIRDTGVSTNGQPEISFVVYGMPTEAKNGGSPDRRGSIRGRGVRGILGWFGTQ